MRVGGGYTQNKVTGPRGQDQAQSQALRSGGATEADTDQAGRGKEGETQSSAFAAGLRAAGGAFPHGTPSAAAPRLSLHACAKGGTGAPQAHHLRPARGPPSAPAGCTAPAPPRALVTGARDQAIVPPQSQQQDSHSLPLRLHWPKRNTHGFLPHPLSLSLSLSFPIYPSHSRHGPHGPSFPSSASPHPQAQLLPPPGRRIGSPPAPDPPPAQALAYPGSPVEPTLRGHPAALALQRGVGPTHSLIAAADATQAGALHSIPTLETDPLHRPLNPAAQSGSEPELLVLDTLDTPGSARPGPAVGALARNSAVSPEAVRIPLPALEVDPLEAYVRAGVRPDIEPEDAIELSGVRRDAGGIPTTEPQQVHISLWGPQRMLVTWVTSDHSAPSVVDYGTDPGDLSRTAAGSAESYSYVVYRSGIVHRVVLGTEEAPLKADTTYYYRCGNEGREMSFKTPPDKFPLNVAIVGDLGQTGWSVSTLEHIEEQPHDMLVLPGDLSYADRYQPRWDSWGHLVEPLASKRPWMVVAGNHEEEDIPLLEPERFKAYNTRWPLPASASPVPSPSNLYYSFETAGVHWVMLASYDDAQPGSAQYEWLERDLAAVDRGRTPWLVAVLHAPWYNSNSAHQGDGEAMRRSMETLLYAHGTDLLFAGHVHAYERSAPVFERAADPCGIVHVTIGDGGNYEGLATRYLDPQPEWSLMREASFGHGELAFHEDGSADWLWHRNQDDESIVADAVRLYPHSMRVRSQGGPPGAAGPVMCTASK